MQPLRANIWRTDKGESAYPTREYQLSLSISCPSRTAVHSLPCPIVHLHRSVHRTKLTAFLAYTYVWAQRTYQRMQNQKDRAGTEIHIPLAHSSYLSAWRHWWTQLAHCYTRLRRRSPWIRFRWRDRRQGLGNSALKREWLKECYHLFLPCWQEKSLNKISGCGIAQSKQIFFLWFRRQQKNQKVIRKCNRLFLYPITDTDNLDIAEKRKPRCIQSANI